MGKEELAKQAFKKGYEIGYGVEELSSTDHKVINKKFDEWWSKNVEE